MSNNGEIIPPNAYPQMADKESAAKLAKDLRSPENAARGGRVISARANILKDAVHDYVDAMEQGAHDNAIVLENAYEIRAIAETAGLVATGRIAEGLCLYFEGCRNLNANTDPMIVALHVGAILRTARATDEAGRLCVVVAHELAALVSQKLAEIKKSR